MLLLCFFSIAALFALEGCDELKSKKTILSSSRLYRVELGKKFGYISEAKVVIKPQFDDAKEFTEGLAAVKLDKKWGYIDRTGRYVIKPRFDYACSFAEGLAAVKLDKKWGYIDRTGRHAAGILRAGKKGTPVRKKTGQQHRDRN